MAHPTANGFLGASFPAGGIPAAYTLIANKFFDLVDKNEVSLLKLWFIKLWEKVIIKDAGFVYESLQIETNRVIWDFCFHETNPRNESFKNESTKRIHDTNP